MNNLVKYDFDKVNEKDIPVIIAGQAKEIKNLKREIESARAYATDAKLRAENAKNKSAGLFHKKEAIESLQDATVELAEAQYQTVVAQEVSFEYQKRLGEISKYLFGLGCSSIAANRSVVRELKLALEGASQEEFDELAKKEIANVIKQLKSQEDIMNQQTELAKKVKYNAEKIAKNSSVGEELEKKILQSIEHEKKQDLELVAQSLKDEEHDRLLQERFAKDAEQDRELAMQALKDEEHDQLLKESLMRDQKQDEILANQAEKDKEHDTLIADLKQQLSDMNCAVIENKRYISEIQLDVQAIKEKKMTTPLTWVAFGMAIIALVGTILQFFI